MRILLKIFLIGTIVGLPFFAALKSVLSGNIPFWYDPARDFLISVTYLQKPGLIGPTTGIPGLFYGPYWNWAITLLFHLSKDPRFITIVLLTSAYGLLLPFILWKLARFWGNKVSLIIYLLFASSYFSYYVFLWNIHHASLFYFLLLWAFATTVQKKPNITQLVSWIGVGAIAGLILNTQVSFGIAVSIASFVSMLVTTPYLHKSFKKTIQFAFLKLFFFSGGFIALLLPFILFEIKHGFNQVKSIITMISNSLLYNSAVVGQTGLTHAQINDTFISLPGVLFHSQILGLCFISFLLGFCLWKITQWKKDTHPTNNILLFALLTLAALVYTFHSTKNPVWSYHFNGTEVVILAILGVLLARFSFLKVGLGLWACFVFVGAMVSLYIPNSINPLSLPNLVTKEHIVKTILTDSQQMPFSVAVFSPAIYTFDFDYLFWWLGEKYGQKPAELSESSKLVYVIIPKTSDALKEDFIHYKTPDNQYITTYTWEIPDGTTVLKRVKK